MSCRMPAPPCVTLKKSPPAPPLPSVCVPDVLANVTVLDPGVNVPPVLDQLPVTVKVPAGAPSVPVPELLTLVLLTGPVEPLKAPLETARAPVLTVPLAAVSVPPLTVSPPVNVCVPALARKMPPLNVVRPVTVIAWPLA